MSITVSVPIPANTWTLVLGSSSSALISNMQRTTVRLAVAASPPASGADIGHALNPNENLGMSTLAGESVYAYSVNIEGELAVTGVSQTGTINLLASAARTATETSPNQVSSCKGCYVIINVTALTATPLVTPSIQGVDPISGTLFTIATGPVISTTGITVMRLYPGITASPNLAFNDLLPSTWNVKMTHADADSITYSVASIGVI